jgi:uncharacterized protein YjiS (DUF1127 family)
MRSDPILPVILDVAARRDIRSPDGQRTDPGLQGGVATRHPRLCVVRAAGGRALRRAAGLLRSWRRRIAESDELRTMSDRELRDFGINRYEAEYEARKAFWRL